MLLKVSVRMVRAVLTRCEEGKGCPMRMVRAVLCEDGKGCPHTHCIGLSSSQMAVSSRWMEGRDSCTATLSESWPVGGYP